MNVQNYPFSESFFQDSLEAIDGSYFDIFYLDTFIFQIHSYLQAEICEIISQ